MGLVQEKIIVLSRQLYPKGKAFKMPFNSNLERLHRALALSEERAWNDAVSTLDSTLPDNESFTAEDAAAWERRYGLIINESVSLTNRRLAIQRKMNHPGRVKARQARGFLEKSLQDAGFNVYVHENIPEQNPITLSGSSVSNQFGDFQFGDAQFGSYFNNIIANYIEEEKDRTFNIGENLRNTFFIGGEVLGGFADVDIERKDEFRELILKVKGVHLTGFLFINYV